MVHKAYNEIRLRRGKSDDIVIDGVDVHLEDMTSNVWWLGLYKGNKRTTFWIRSSRKIHVEIIENDLKSKFVEQEKAKK